MGKKKNGCLRCCIVALIVAGVLLVLVGGGCAVGCIYANKFLAENYDITLGECWKMVTGALSAKEKDIVNDPATEQDSQVLYDQLRKTLFLNENADLKGVLDEYIGSLMKEEEDVAPVYASEDASATEQNQLLSLVTELYTEGNVDLTRLRSIIAGEIDVVAEYNEEFVAKIDGNGLVGMMKDLISSVLEQSEETKRFAGIIELKQVSFSKKEQGAAVFVAVKINLREAISVDVEEAMKTMPSFLVSIVKGMLPKETFVTAELTLSEPAALSVGINKLGGELMNKLFDFIGKISGEDLSKVLSDSVEEVIAPIRNENPEIIKLLSNVDENGKLNIDAYGLLADIFNKDKPEQDRLKGEEIVSFLAGVLGSDAEAAIADRINQNAAFGEDDWQTKQAQALVSAMADSFALAESYFVNGTDENGNKILSVDNGIVTGTDKIIGRVYVDSTGNLYYKKSGGKFKVFISDDMKVSPFALDGYAEYHSTDLHYMANGKEHVLYRSADGKNIRGVYGGEAVAKNGTYTELTTLYVDADGNVFSQQNAEGSLIVITKEKLTVDTIFNIIGSQSAEIEDILDLIDFAAIRQNGTASWLNPMRITDAQLAAIVNEAIYSNTESDLLKAEPSVAYVEIFTKDGDQMVTLGVKINISALMTEDISELISTLIGESIYAEITCDVTLDKQENEYKPVTIKFNDLDGDYTQNMLDTIGKIDAEINITGELENAARSVRNTIKELDEKISINFVDGGIQTVSPAEIIIPLLTDKEVDAEAFVGAIETLLFSDYDVAVSAAQTAYPLFAVENWQQQGVNALCESIAEAFILKKDKFKVEGSENYSLDKVMDIIDGGSFAVSSISEYLDYDTMKTQGFDGWRSAFGVDDLAVSALVDRVKNEGFADYDGLNPEIVYVHMLNEGGREIISVALSVDFKNLFEGNDVFDRFLSVMGDKGYIAVEIDVTFGAEQYNETSLTINDLTVEQTNKIFETIKLFSDEFDKEKIVSQFEGKVRESLGDIRENIDFAISDGAIEFAAPQDIIFETVVQNPDEQLTASDMTDALEWLLSSNYGAAVSAAQTAYPLFAVDNWQQQGVNALCESIAEAFILKKDKFKVEGSENYSLDKVMDIIDGGSFDLSSIEEMLDYDTMKTEGFGKWSSRFAVTDPAVAAIVERVKDAGFADYESLNPEIVYVHMSNAGELETISIALSFDFKNLFNGNGDFDHFLNVMDDKGYISVVIDITEGVENQETDMVMNDLSAAQTDKILDVIELFSNEFDRSKLLALFEDEVRGSIDSIRGNVGFDVGDGEMVFAAPQDTLYASLVTTPSDDFTASDLTSALTTFALTANEYYEQNGGYVASTTNDEALHAFWTNTLKEKYFLNADVDDMFTGIINGGNMYDTLLASFDKSLIAPNGVYAHESIASAEYKASSEQLSYIMRTHSSDIATSIGTDVMSGATLYRTQVQASGDKAKTSIMIVVPTSNVVGMLTSADVSLKNMINGILPEKVAIDIMWTQGDENAEYTLSGMTTEQRNSVDKMIKNTAGTSVFGEGSDVASAANNAKAKFEEWFIVGVADGEGYVKFTSLYEMLAERLFVPTTGLPEITAQDVYNAMKQLYVMPETEGAFDASKVGEGYVVDSETVTELADYVSDETYTLVGATTLSVEATDPPKFTANIKATIKYTLALNDDASVIMPTSVYLTVIYDANGHVSSLGIDIDRSNINTLYNRESANDSLAKCLEYFCIDVDAAIESACGQIDQYVEAKLS